MGDDRHGRAPRPGGRAPWERYPTADYTERDGTRASRRSRHADTASDSDSAPISVQDLVERVDNERTGRRRRAENPAQATNGTAPPANGVPAARHAESAPPRTTSSPVVQDIAGTKAPTAARPVARATEDTRRAIAAPSAPIPQEQVTDKLPAVTETARATRKPATSKTETAARPKAVGSPPLSRLAAGRQRKHKKLQLAGRVGTAFFAVLVLLITGFGWNYVRSTDNGLTHVSAIDDDQTDVLDSMGQLGDENYLIVGTDTRAGVNGQMGAGTLDDAEGSRADTVMLVNIPKNRQRVVVVSFPRDLDVTRPVCQGWNNDKGSYTDESYPAAIGDKLNAVYALGGPKCLVNVIRKMSGLNIGHFIGVDFAGFEAMVNQVGGVEVCSPKPIIDGILGTVLESSGKQRVDGGTALNYVRARHVYGEERSDYDRINRQQRFLASLLRGALSSKVLLDPGKLNGFIGAFTAHTFVDNVKTQDLLMLGRSLQKVDAGAVTFLTIPTAGTTSYGNEIPRDTDIKAIFRAVIDDQPLPGEKKAPDPTKAPGSAPPAPPRLVAVDPGAFSLLVSNGSGISGAANKAANKLGSQGFQIYSTGNYSGGTSAASKVRFPPGHEAEAATVASAIPGALIEQSSEQGSSIIEVVIGTDFGGTVKAPTPIGDTIANVPLSANQSATPVTLPADLEHMNAADDTCK
ncbi:LCP family protein [Nocardia sp. NPDC052566]|uniref:LCP family protein n=1 Tax=Nocardia sp. NPDC052566 TaxID=3364330 RepID=UPI0037CAB409